MGSGNLKYLSYFLLYTLTQVFFLRNNPLFHVAFPFMYVGFIILLPININRLLLLVVAFFYGLTIDLFYSTLGINAAACVLVAFLRIYVLNFITDNSSDDVNEPNLQDLGFKKFSFFCLILLFLHHLILFYSEAFSFNAFFYTFYKVIMSALFSYFLIVCSQYLFFYKKRRR